VGFVVEKVALEQAFPCQLHSTTWKSSSSQGCTISLKVAVRPQHSVAGPFTNQKKTFLLSLSHILLSALFLNTLTLSCSPTPNFPYKKYM
jgi:hypothetical protein